MRIKRVPSWEGVYGGWSFSWGLLKNVAATHIMTGQTLTAEDICVLAYISAQQEKEGNYLVAISERPTRYRIMDAKGLIDLRLVNRERFRDRMAAYWEEVTITCDVLECIPIPHLIDSLLVEAGWESDWQPNSNPDRPDVRARPDLWQMIEVWMSRLTTAELPGYITHPHFAVNALANMIVRLREGTESFPNHKYLFDLLVESWNWKGPLTMLVKSNKI